MNMLNFMILFDILQLFQDYGAILSILILAVLTSIYMIRTSTRRIREQEQKIDKLIDKFTDKLTEENTGELTGKFINYAENANKIQIQLYHMLQTFEAERVSIYEFHNGGRNLQGVEFKKCSNTYEAVELETKPIIKEMQNLPLSINPLWNKLLATHKNIDIPSVEKLEDSFLRLYLETQSIKTYYLALLEDYDNSPIGFITLEYYKNVRGLTEEERREFNAIAIKISVLINLK